MDQLALYLLSSTRGKNPFLLGPELAVAPRAPRYDGLSMSQNMGMRSGYLPGVDHFNYAGHHEFSGCKEGIYISIPKAFGAEESEVDASSSAVKEHNEPATEISTIVEPPDDPDCPKEQLSCNGCGGHVDMKCKGLPERNFLFKGCDCIVFPPRQYRYETLEEQEEDLRQHESDFMAMWEEHYERVLDLEGCEGNNFDSDEERDEDEHVDAIADGDSDGLRKFEEKDSANNMTDQQDK